MIASLIQVALVCAPTLAFIPSPIWFANTRAENAVAASPLTFDVPFGLQSDDALATVRRLDSAERGADGKLAPLTPEEHMRRAAIYLANRAFNEARDHWQTLTTRHPTDRNAPAALFNIGRSFFQQQRYADALPVFERLGREHPQTKDGRDGFYYVAPTLLRMNRPAEAATRYQAYLAQFPQGERIEDAHLNIIDSLREAGRSEEARLWVARTRTRFPNTPVATNALFANLRLEIAGSNWQAAARTSDELRRSAIFGRGVMTSSAELSYLHAYSLERAGSTEQAIKIYQAIPDGPTSYYGGLATARLQTVGGVAKQIADARASRVRTELAAASGSYPAPYREAILRYTSARKVDPRLMLAIMRQESGFRPRAKSVAAARGLMQLTIDTAAKYAPRAQLGDVREEDLYRPEASVQLASEYLAALMKLFPNLPEAVAASYNGGEDNVARWLRRAGQPDPGVFTSEVGFAETKDYVAKVMANYRAYRELYTNDLRRR